jgi:hypothetical protein
MAIKALECSAGKYFFREWGNGHRAMGIGHRPSGHGKNPIRIERASKIEPF